MSVKDDLESAKETLCEQANDLNEAQTIIAAAKALVEQALEAVCNEGQALQLCNKRLVG